MEKEEIWLPVKGFEGYYEVSNMGNIRRTKSKRLRAISHTEHYSHVLLSVNGHHRTLRVHRLVAEAFLPKIDEKTHVNHKNGDRHDNRVENLEWVTQAENNLHAYRVLHKKATLLGCIPANRVVKDSDIPEMDRLNREGMTTDNIGTIYGISGSTVRKHLRQFRKEKHE